VAALDEPKVLEARGHLFVGVCIEGADRAQVLLSFKRKVKIASENKVAQLIAAALPGLNLHDPAPVPGGVPSMAGYDYFELDRSHPLWDDVRRASNVGVYLPRDMEQLKLDLVGNWE
jgi:predicted component of type VI protein secretion system